MRGHQIYKGGGQQNALDSTLQDVLTVVRSTESSGHQVNSRM